jgi:hypothetical protein
MPDDDNDEGAQESDRKDWAALEEEHGRASVQPGARVTSSMCAPSRAPASG